jgi:dynein heavy chain
MRELLKESIEKHFPEDREFVMRDPLLFGDYRNAMNEGESRIYEDLLDYDAIYYLLQEVCPLDEISQL